jgi:hypothetical protein
MRRQQQGITITGFVIFSILFVLGTLLAFKLVPVFTEYFAIQRQFRSLAEDPAVRSGQRAAFERAWAARATVEDIRSIDGRDIDIAKQGDQIVISGAYSVKVPLFRNVAACFDFTPTSAQ